LVDSFIGKYKTPNDLVIGDRSMTNLIELKSENNKVFQNVKKFENQCKRHPVEEKSHMILIWCKKITDAWEKRILTGSEQYLKTAQGK